MASKESLSSGQTYWLQESVQRSSFEYSHNTATMCDDVWLGLGPLSCSCLLCDGFALFVSVSAPFDLVFLEIIASVFHQHGRKMPHLSSIYLFFLDVK